MNKLKVGINGFGRIGRLALRAAWEWPDMEFVAINDPGADAATLAHLLNFDSVHGRWNHEVGADGENMLIDGQRIRVTRTKNITMGVNEDVFDPVNNRTVELTRKVGFA